MSDTVDIGAARIRLIVDSTDMQAALAQGKSYVANFGTAAQASYDKTEKGTRRAADALLDYVSALGSADTTMTRLIKTASKLGVEKPVIDDATAAWQRYQDAIEATNEAQEANAASVARSQAAYKELITTQAQAEIQANKLANSQAAQRIAANQQNASNAKAVGYQGAVNSVFAPGLTSEGSSSAEQSAQAFLGLIEAEAEAERDQAAAVLVANAAYKELITTQTSAAEAARNLANAQAATRIQNLAAAHAANSQNDVNSLVAPGLGVGNNSAAESAAVFLQAIEAQEAAQAELNDELDKQLALTNAIAEARQAQNATIAQQDYNKLLGIPDQQQDLALIEARKNATAAFLPMLEQEAQLEQENSALVSKQQAFLAELEQLAATAGKTGTELQQLKAAQLGISEQAAPLIKSVADANSQISSGTISAKQYAFALKGLPAQFTDIVVSLQGGQRPLTVLLQQGGQIKDMFGGVGSAIKVVAVETAKILTNPYLILGGIVAGLAVSAYEASQRMTDLAIATARGNQVAGQAGGLSTLAKSLQQVGQVSLGNADAAVEFLAAAGKLSGDNFTRAAQASARWATITGQSIDDVAGKFDELASNPLEAVLSGTLKVTSAQFEQLEALDRTGDKIGEVSLAVKLYQEQVNSNSDSVLKNLSDTEKGWIDIKTAISDAVGELGSYVAAAAKAAAVGIMKTGQSLGSGINDIVNPIDGSSVTGNLLKSFAGIDDNPAPTTWSPAQMMSATEAVKQTNAVAGSAADAAAAINGVNAAIADNNKLTPIQADAIHKLDGTFDSLATKGAAKFNVLMREINANLRSIPQADLTKRNITRTGTDAYNGAGYATLVADARQKAYGQNEGGDPTKPILEQQKTLLDMLKTLGDATSAFYANGDISAEQYYDSVEALAVRSADIQTATINEEIAALKKRNNPSDLEKTKALYLELATVQETLSASTIKNAQDESKAVAARQAALNNYIQALADANNQLSRQGDQAAAAVGTGSRESSYNNSVSNAKYTESLAERAAQQKVDQLPDDGTDHSDAQAQADKDKAAAVAALSTQLDILKGNYASLSDAESSFLNGSTKAWQDWSDSVANNAAVAQKVTTTFLDGLADAFATAATKGKFSISSLFQSLEQQVVEAGLKIAEEKAISALLNMGGNGGGGDSVVGGSGFGGLAIGIGSLLFSAKGNAFGSGTGLSSYRNSIVKSPTVFPFAAGGVPNVGVMGEKPGSPGEAIMPLTRTANGDLGVKVSGQQGGNTNNVTQVFVVPDATKKSTQDQLAMRSYGAATRAVRRNG